MLFKDEKNWSGAIFGTWTTSPPRSLKSEISLNHTGRVLDKCLPKAHMLEAGGQPVALRGSGTFKRLGLRGGSELTGGNNLRGYWDLRAFLFLFHDCQKWAASCSTHSLPACSASPQSQRRQGGIKWPWNLWNPEPTWNFFPKRYLRCFHSDRNLTNTNTC